MLLSMPCALFLKTYFQTTYIRLQKGKKMLITKSGLPLSSPFFLLPYCSPVEELTIQSFSQLYYFTIIRLIGKSCICVWRPEPASECLLPPLSVLYLNLESQIQLDQLACQTSLCDPPVTISYCWL